MLGCVLDVFTVFYMCGVGAYGVVGVIKRDMLCAGCYVSK